MADRLELHKVLLTILPNVYFRTPESMNMKYPAIRYGLSRINRRYANNGVYNEGRAYELTLIDRDPDSEYVDDILKLPFCSFDRSYTADGLNHWVFTLHF